MHHNVAYHDGFAGINFNNNYGADVKGNATYNNTLGDAQSDSILYRASSGTTGDVARNNLVPTTVNAPSSVAMSNNVTSSTATLSATQPDFRLASGSPAIDAGTPITGITTNAVGPAPDAGTHESSGTDWTAGCNLAGCAFPKDPSASLDDQNAAITYSGSGWSHCTTGCGSASGSILYGDTASYSASAGDSVTINFTGTQAQIYGYTANNGGIGNVSVDGGPVSSISYFTSLATGNALMYTTPLLSSGSHTVTITVAGSARYGAGEYVWLDRVTVTNPARPTTSVDDATTGTTDRSWIFSGTTWTACTSNCNTTFGATFYNGTITYSKSMNNYAIISFIGSGIQLYGSPGTGGGYAGVQVDQDAEASVTFYATSQTGNALLYTSPNLPWGSHTLKVRVTGTTGAGGGSYVNVDRVVITG